MHKSKTGLLLLGMAFGLVACNGVAQERITATAAMETATVVLPTMTPVPTATFTPTATLRADGPLSDEGPYLIYNDIEDGVNSIVLVNGDGSGRMVIPLPENSTINNLGNSLSPDGQWLAFHVGTLSDTFEEAADDSLTLNLMHLPDGEITEVMNLLSDDFQDKFQLMADRLFTRDDNPEYMTSSEAYLSSIWNTFRYGVDTMAWSPLGNYLAFSAQTEGISSDVYLYEVQTQTTLRLSDEIDNIQYMKWSPSETYLLFGATHEENVADTNVYYVAEIERRSVREISVNYCGGSRIFAEWLSEYQILTYCRVSGWGPGSLMEGDLLSRSFREIYSNHFMDYLYDAEGNELLIATAMLRSTDSEEASNYTSGIRFFYPETGEETFLREGLYESLIEVSGRDYKYLAGGYYLVGRDQKETIGITEDGEIIPISSYENFWKPSPNMRWVSFHSFDDELMIVSLQSDQIYNLPEFRIARTIWHSDSKGIFFSTPDHELFYYDFMNNVVELIDSFIEDRLLSLFAWVP